MTSDCTATGTPIAPERTFALVVGVEQYDIGASMSLSGAARDALRFAAWLTDTAGVPRSNVRMLLSPLDRNRIDPEAKPATRENVEAALFKDLPDQNGDLLWIYWAGHGFLDDYNQLLLPYADATNRHTTHLNLTSALRWWKSDKVSGGRFRRLVAIGDSCRIDKRRAKDLGFVTVDYQAGTPVPERLQFTLYATRPGETAKNQAERDAGQFTHTLLGHLDGMPLEYAVRGLVGVAQAVQADFTLMKKKGTAWQEPQFEIGRDWNGSSLFGDHWTDDGTASGPAGAPVLDQLAWSELGELLKDCPLPPYTFEAYRWAFEVTGCVPPDEHRLPSQHLTEIVRDLDSRQGTSHPLPLALPFIRHLASRSSRSEWAAQAESWVERTRERLGAAPVAVPPGRTPERPALHIRLAPETGDAFRVGLWLFDGDFRKVGDWERPMDLDAVRVTLGTHLLAATARPPARIEFHVPYDLLHEPFETWRIPTGRGDRTAALGSRYEVVLRCPEERQGLAEAPWRNKWRWYETHGGLHPDAVRQIGDHEVCENLADELQLTEPPVCVLAEVTESRVTETLDAVLDGGIPIAVWRRPAAEDGATGSIRALLGAEPSAALDVQTLPARLRRACSARHPLALLWDHPGRIPPVRRSLST
ncbi:caspase family protein [Streptomyces sp. JB150]|uniref:VMAP-C domain-containing protein n=1 Tax=Streptomyces sp. JB150 TaxID=2714844 RepID=UPI001408135B|nr:caspase family protein [Streptomyces sp. JB150]QIJ65315.1 caspase family protein [Streptomyces sp. JB150]